MPLTAEDERLLKILEGLITYDPDRERARKQADADAEFVALQEAYRKNPNPFWDYIDWPGRTGGKRRRKWRRRTRRGPAES